jgi:hypothetical protein
MLPAFLIGLAFGVLVGLLIARIRQSGESTSPTIARITSPTPPDARTTVLGGFARRTGIGPGRIEVERRIEAKLTPDGMTITVDGETFHRLEDIPDQAAAERVRQLLVTLPSSVEDPTARAKIEGELHDVGIDPDAGQAGST